MRSPRTREFAALSSARGGEEDSVDWQSNASATSTVATTTSLQSRIAALALDLEDAARKEREGEELGTFPEEEEEEEAEEQEDQQQQQQDQQGDEVLEVTEEQVLKLLDSQEDPFRVCSRLFYRKVSNPMFLRRLHITHVEEFKQHGYLVLDNFLPKECAAAIRLEALSASFQDTGARGDSIMWLHMGQPPMDTPAFGPMAVAFQELQEDLQEFMKLRNQTAEYQLACYPGSGAFYKKHRDAFPDGGSEEQLRRVSAVVYMNPDWKQSDGGALRLWPPRKPIRPSSIAEPEHRQRTSDQLGDSHSGHTVSVHFNAHAAHRQAYGAANSYRHFDPYHTRALHESSPRPMHFDGQAGPISEPEISVSEPSECGSLRSDGIDAALYMPKSTTSSVMAEVGIHDGAYDASSIDDLSVASRDHDNAKTGIEWVEVGGGMVLEIMPQAGRLVLFLSGAVDHAVKPTLSERVAVTAWYH